MSTPDNNFHEEWGAFKQAFSDHAKNVEKMLTDHEKVLYGDGVDKPGLIGMCQDNTETLAKVKKLSLAAVGAAITGLVGLVFKLIHIPGVK